MKFASYELVPADVQEKLLKAYEATQSRRIGKVKCHHNFLIFKVKREKAGFVKSWPFLLCLFH